MTYDWVVVGGGVSGIALGEILTREGHRVLLADKGEQLAGETTRVFHEWIHAGSLYTVVPGQLLTAKYMLGALDDLMEYYGSFERMNLGPTESGLAFDGAAGWFDPNHIRFRYRRRPWNVPWSLNTARSAYLIEQIKRHDWLRRRAGVLENFRGAAYRSIARRFAEVTAGRGEFYDVDCPDFTTRSRLLLRDLVATALSNGLELALGSPVLRIERQAGRQLVVTGQRTYEAANVVVCAGRSIQDFFPVGVTTSYAPIAVVDGLGPSARSFVELDYFVKTCINLITKPGGVGLIGGISFADKARALEYLDYVVERHKAVNPGLRVLGSYLGEKNEIVFKGQDRSYLFHIVPTGPGLWAVVPGKFTLAFSLAPEFYRRVYRKNPRKHFKTTTDSGDPSVPVAETLWREMVEKAGSQAWDKSSCRPRP